MPSIVEIIGVHPFATDPRNGRSFLNRVMTSGGYIVRLVLRPQRAEQTGHRLLAISHGGAFHGGFPQPYHVAHGRRAEKPLVLAGEVRGIGVAHPVAGARSVEILG